MDSITTTNHQVISQEALENAVELWTKATTDTESARYLSMLRDKSNSVLDFFAFSETTPANASQVDVQRWLDDMREERELANTTIYARASMLSSFFQWLREDATMRQFVTSNPVELVRPKAPKAYQGSEALSDEQLEALLAVVRDAAATSLTGKRDYAMLLFYLLTGHRREEVNRLRWEDLKRNGTLQVKFLTKGGDYHQEQVNLLCWDALVEYLAAAGRLDAMTPDEPLWLGHDAAGQASGALSSYSFSKNLKRYARLAGLGNIHIHQLRHTVARMVGEDSGDITAVQRVLGHKNVQTTRVYLARIETKRDTHSDAIARRLGL